MQPNTYNLYDPVDECAFRLRFLFALGKSSHNLAIEAFCRNLQARTSDVKEFATTQKGEVDTDTNATRSNLQRRRLVARDCEEP
jgi:hypothetical protein